MLATFLKCSRTYLVLLVLLNFIKLSHTADDFPQITANNQALLRNYEPNVYIVHLNVDNNANEPLKLTCDSGKNSLDMNFTFSGVDQRTESTPPDQINKPSRKILDFSFNTPLVVNYTGLYTCESRYSDNIKKINSWYIYFFPGNGKLFLDCTKLPGLSSCILFYRLKVPFRVPCQALHPAIVVSSDSKEPQNVNELSELNFYNFLNDNRFLFH
jgi:hypothetical protein